MAGERRLRILALLAESAGGETQRLCDVCAEVTSMSGAGIMLMSTHVPQGSVCTSNDVSALIEELQYALGEGPCVDAYHQNRPVIEGDLADPVRPRWLAFAGPALEAGVRSIFGFPLQVGAVRLGALDLYSDQPGRLTPDQHANALVMADVAAEVVLAMQSNAPPGRLAAELEAGGNFEIAVHQATGRVAAQLNISVGEALVRLRAYAFGNDRPLREVAQAVVAGELRFDTEADETDPSP